MHSLVRLFAAVLFAAAAPVPAGAVMPVPPPKPPMTDVAIRFERVVSHGGNRWAEFAIANDSDHPVWFMSFDKKDPLPSVECWLGGKWVPRSPQFFCGTGMGIHSLAARAELRFQVAIQGAESGRAIRVGVFLAAARNLDGMVYWSEKTSGPKSDS